MRPIGVRLTAPTPPGFVNVSRDIGLYTGLAKRLMKPLYRHARQIPFAERLGSYNRPASLARWRLGSYNRPASLARWRQRQLSTNIAVNH
jgi:hypothetical protein